MSYSDKQRNFISFYLFYKTYQLHLFYGTIFLIKKETNMNYFKKSEAEFYSGDGYSGMDYPMSDTDINFAVIHINGRSPKTGYQVNTKCKELLYIIEGSGILYLKDNQQVQEFHQGDVIVLQKSECYAFEGNFEAAVPCTPAWTSEQHKYVD